MPTPEAAQLIERYLEGALDAAEQARLETLLTHDPAVAAALVEACRLERGIGDLLRQERGQQAETARLAPLLNSAPAPSWAFRTLVFWSSPLRFGIVVATVTCVSLLLTAAQLRLDFASAPSLAPQPQVESGAPVVARIAHHERCHWAARAAPANRGLRSGRELVLEAGQVQLTFHDGAVVAIRGPAKFAAGQGSLTLNSGGATCSVPPRAVGFVVETPSSRIVDLGTEFRVWVDPQGDTEVEVLTGKVQTHPRPQAGSPASPPVELTARQAARIEAVSRRVTRRTVPHVDAAAALRVHYPLDESPDSPPTVLDAVGSRHGTLLAAPRRGLPGVHGQAYLFQDSGVQLPAAALHATERFTLTFWVNFSQADSMSRLVECTDVPGTFERGYRILGVERAISFRVRQPGGTNLVVEQGEASLGQWQFVAARYESGGQMQLTTIPFQPRPIHAAEVAVNTVATPAAGPPLTFANCVSQLGRALPHPTPIHPFRGMLDDVAFFEAVLADDQIVQVYNEGARVFASPHPHPRRTAP